jgi:hypothetical protein
MKIVTQTWDDNLIFNLDAGGYQDSLHCLAKLLLR